MEKFFHKQILTIYWFVLMLSAVFLYFDLPYTAITEPLLVPILLVFVLLRDNNISKPAGKFIFYMGLILAFLGDVLQVVINNEIFFLSSLVAFMLMNICYSISFWSLNKPGLVFLSGILLFSVTGYLFVFFFGDEMGLYKMPVIFYMCTLSAMIALAANVMSNKQHRKTAVTYLFPGAIIFFIQNAILAMNLFHFSGQNRGYVFSIIPYGIAQYLMVKGILKVYPLNEY